MEHLLYVMKNSDSQIINLINNLAVTIYYNTEVL